MSVLEALHSLSSSKLIPTADGAYTIKDQQGRFVHSSRSPLKESQKLLMNLQNFSSNNTLVIVWGVGLGYHVESLILQGYDVVAIELRPEISSVFQEIFPIHQLKAFITDVTTIFDVLVQLENSYQRFIDISMLGVSIPQEAWKLKKQAVTALQSLHNIKLNLIDTWYLNIIHNLSLLKKDHIGYTYDPLFKGRELIICSAGPSLKESLPALKENRQYFTILCVDTALSTLLDANIIPDVVHAVDAKIHNIMDFRGIEEDIFSKMILIADLTLSPQIVQLPWKNVLFVSTAQPLQKKETVVLSRHHLQQFLWDREIRFPETQTGGSVATSAFHLGLLYQADKILLIGQDLAYSNHRGHAVGSPYDKQYRLETNRLNTLDTIHIQKIPFNHSTKGIVENEVYTDPLLEQFRSWFEVSIKDNHSLTKIVINSSENGARFEYWEHISLSSYVKLASKTKSLPLIYFISTYTPTKIRQICAELTVLDESHVVMKDYFYQQQHINTSVSKIHKKKKQWHQKIALN